MHDIKRDIRHLFKIYIVPLLQIENKDFKVSPYVQDEHKLDSDFLACINQEHNYIIHVMEEVPYLSNIAQSIWQQIISIYSLLTNSGQRYKEFYYSDSLYESAVVWGISQWLGGGKKNADFTIYKIIRQLMSWSMKTYEGNRVRFGVLIDIVNSQEDEKTDKIDFVNLLNHDSAALVSDGMATYFVVSPNGTVLHITDEQVVFNSDQTPFSPIELKKVCEASIKDNIGICLSSSGDLYCFKRKQLRIARINGKWVCFSYESFHQALINDIQDEKLVKEIYNTCLDVSFARTGGCLAICHSSNKDKENLEDIIPNIAESEKKFPLIPQIHNKNFFDLPRQIRKEYLGIDGATIIGFKGELLRVGAIINSVSPDSDGGGRKAAAMRLSQFGIAIKISADGYIEVIKNKNTIKKFR